MSEPRPTAVLVEDEHQIRRFVRTSLETEGWNVFEAETLKSGLIEAGTRKPDLVILDLGLPDGDGVDLIRRIREWSSIPIFILSGRDRLHEKVAGLNAGADDYLTKPFAPDELLARVRAALRRMAARDRPVATASFETGDLRIDFIRRLVSVRGQRIYLTPTEYRLLVVLVQHADRVVTHQRLLLVFGDPAKRISFTMPTST